MEEQVDSGNAEVYYKVNKHDPFRVKGKVKDRKALNGEFGDGVIGIGQSCAEWA